MNAIRSDAELLQGAIPIDASPARATRRAGVPPWVRIVGLTLLAIIGLVLGAIVGVLLVLSSGLVEFC